jgi:hypothetical protein
VTARAVLAEALDEAEEAARGYEEAVQGWADFGHVLETGNAMLGAGRCLARIGESDAVDRFRRARKAFEDLGAVTLMAEVDASLKRAHESGP